ncbi:MAG TPA: hypothetical protein VIG48_01560 [Jatrophihabitans sp.]|jgi:hypothetical protein
MQEIPKPQLLDPDRVDRDDREDMTAEDHRSQSQLLAKALAESCGYADQLWEQLNQVRGYLLASLPPDPRSPSPNRTAAASPTGPDDDEGWQRWMATFADTTSVLCGSHGDSGYGLSTAKEEAQLRRTAPILTMQHRLAERETATAAAQPSEPPVAQAARPEAGNRWGAVKIAGAVVTATLALRGLRRTPKAR